MDELSTVSCEVTKTPCNFSSLKLPYAFLPGEVLCGVSRRVKVSITRASLSRGSFPGDVMHAIIAVFLGRPNCVF